jgi:hypothetical protein
MKINLILSFILTTILSLPILSQSYQEQSGSDNPFNGINLGMYASPSFVDIDNDGDYDAFIGTEDGIIFFFINNGTPETPLFIEQTGDDNPFQGVDANAYIGLDFVDIDNDGDYDAFIGNIEAEIWYYENTGTDQAPIFTKQYGEDNPLDLYDTGWEAKPDFIDIDGDGDFDVFIGDDYGVIRFYRNTGDSENPVFTEETGENNPLDSEYVGDFAKPVFFDLDQDNDFDAIIGEDSGKIHFFENKANNNEALFEQVTGENNPFDFIDVGTESKPDYADIDNDDDIDLFIGNEDGYILFFKNIKENTFMSHQNLFEIRTFPNPAENVFKVTVYGSETYFVELLNISAKVLVNKTVKKNEFNIDISPYSSGIYFLKISNGIDFRIKQIVKL